MSEDVLIDFVVAGERAGMRARRPRPGRSAPGFEHDHRFFLGDPLGNLGERAAVLQVLAMLRDDLRVFVLLEEGEKIVLVDVGLVAEADDRGDAHLGRATEADDRHADAARLRGERRLAFHVVGRAEILRRVIEAVDVRPHQADAVFPRDADELLLAVDVAGLGEARRNEDRARDPLLADLDQGLGDELRRDCKDGDIDRARHVLDALVGLQPHDLLGLRVDRVDLPLVAAVDEVLHHRVADLRPPTRRRPPRLHPAS